MKPAYAIPTIADQGPVVARTLGCLCSESLEPVSLYRHVNSALGRETLSGNESLDGLDPETSVNSRSTE